MDGFVDEAADPIDECEMSHQQLLWPEVVGD